MEYPDNGAYMVAAYIVAAVVLVVYSVGLSVRIMWESRENAVKNWNSRQ